MNNNINYFKEQFDLLQSAGKGSRLGEIRKQAFADFSQMGIPTSRHEEWKYTRIAGLFNREYQMATRSADNLITKGDLEAILMPGHEEANTIFFVNGLYAPELSTTRCGVLTVLPLEEAAAGQYAGLVTKHLGHSGQYLKDGINALNTAFAHGGVFIHLPKGKMAERPVYIYHISDARNANSFSLPRSLVFVSERASLQVVESFTTLGSLESFTNQVIEMVVEKDALLEYYKIQNDTSLSSQVSTTHIHQTGKSYTHSVVISLNGAIIRNNLNTVLDADHCESHLYGLYCLEGDTHVDNHTVVDNVKPHCFSNELYKGVVGDRAAAVFNGKIFVRKDAQKTNAYQSNKNVLVSDEASVNSKPQLEIFADDVKCSHGCTVGSLDEEALFYLRSRGLSQENARSLLLRAFALDILENIKLPSIRTYVDHLISERLEIDAA
jgi:Fe-S cluster assembly protein SufD